MFRFQKLTRNLSTYTGTTYTVSSSICPSFSCATSSSLLMLTAGPRGQFPRCCKRRQPPSPLAIPFAGTNTEIFLSLRVVKDSIYVQPLPMSLKELRDRITHVVQTITADMIHRVWDEFDYRVEVCRVTQGAHIEGL